MTPPSNLLCETCGYPLPGPPHAARAACPECGRPVTDSLPERRPGAAWQHRTSPGGWTRTAAALARSPGRFFDTLSTRGGPGPDRLYLLINACAAGVIAGVLTLALHRQSPLTAWLVGMGTAKGVLLFSYVEAAGLWFFSRRRGWRVPFRRAERIVAYASVGWLPAAALLAAAAPALAGPGADALGQRLLGAPTPARPPAAARPARRRRTGVRDPGLGRRPPPALRQLNGCVAVPPRARWGGPSAAYSERPFRAPD